MSLGAPSCVQRLTYKQALLVTFWPVAFTRRVLISDSQPVITHGSGEIDYKVATKMFLWLRVSMT